MFTLPIILPVGGELKAQAGWAVGTGLWAKGQRRAAAWAIWITKHRSPLQPHPGDPQPPAPRPPGLGEDQSQLHLGPSPRGAAPSHHLPHGAHLDGRGCGTAGQVQSSLGRRLALLDAIPFTSISPLPTWHGYPHLPRAKGRLKMVS